MTDLSALDVDMLVARFDSEEKCRAYLEHLRWPDGVVCPRCDAESGISRLAARYQYECDSCGYQFSVRVGTGFQGSHLPLWKWFLAIYVMCESPQGVSANQLRRVLGVSYKTAWYLSHRIRTALQAEMPSGLPRAGLVRAVVGPHRHLSAKYFPAYLGEMAFRLNNRDNDHRLRDALLRMLDTPAVSYDDLIRPEQEAVMGPRRRSWRRTR